MRKVFASNLDWQDRLNQRGVNWANFVQPGIIEKTEFGYWIDLDNPVWIKGAEIFSFVYDKKKICDLCDFLLGQDELNNITYCDAVVCPNNKMKQVSLIHGTCPEQRW